MKFFFGLVLVLLAAISVSASSTPFESQCRSCECKCRRARRLRRERSGTPSPYPMEDESGSGDGNDPQPEPETNDKPDNTDGGYPSGQGSCVTCSKDNVNYVNKYRMSMGMGTVRWDDKLAGWADEHSRTMFMQSHLFHSDHGLWENVAYSGFSDWSNTGEGFFEQWRGSSGHNKNMLVDSHKCMGTGIYGDGHTFYATQIFSYECE